MSKPKRSLGQGRSLSSIFLAVSNFSEILFPLVRGMILARLLPPSEFGLAISVTMVASVADLISDLGVSQLAMRYGMSKALTSLHSLAILRGFGLAVAITLLGPCVAMLFGSKDTLLVYAVAGLSSAIRGFSHLEVKGRMQQYRYMPEAITVFGGQAIWTSVSIGAALVIPDYRAMVIGLVASAVGATLMSHAVSSETYRLGWDRKVVTEAWHYGRPLIWNGIAYSITSLGDRFFIGWRLSLTSLAQYSALASAAFLPRTAVARFLTSLFAPQFVNASGPRELQRLADTWLLALATIGGVFGLCFVAGGHEIVALAFGAKYQIDQSLINLVALLGCIRYMSIVSSAPAIAFGRSKLMLVSTVLMALCLIVAAGLLFVQASLSTLISALVVGESLALAVVLNRLSAFLPFTRSVLWFAAIVPISLVSTVLLILGRHADLSILHRGAICLVTLGILLVCMFALLRLSGSSVTSVVHRLFPKYAVATES